MNKINVVSIKEINKTRKKLIALLEKEKNHEFLDEELDYMSKNPEEAQSNLIDWVIEEIEESFYFEEDEE